MKSFVLVAISTLIVPLFSLQSGLKYSRINRSKLNLIDINSVSDLHESLKHIDHNLIINNNIFNNINTLLLNSAEEITDLAKETAANVSPYSKVDKTGFIGFFANFIEIAIDFGRNTFNSVGITNSYGYSIIIFTILVKALTLPLTKVQIESTSRMQQLTPLQQKIQQKYANDETTKNQLLSQLFQAAQVNPLAGCLPALVQIPIFISLYRALTNLVAENKLDEPFLWIPDLEGPTYTNRPELGNWLSTIVTGNPSLGWHDTICFLSLPLILYVSQSISQKILQPPKDPNRVMTEQELFSQGLVNNLPFVVAFFSINVPAGLALYWIVNNLLTTAVTLALKSQIKDEPFPLEVQRMMELVDKPAGTVKKTTVGTKSQEIKSLSDDRLKQKPEGFGTASVVSSGSSLENSDTESDGSATGEGDSETDEDDNSDNTPVEEVKKSNKSKKSKRRRD